MTEGPIHAAVDLGASSGRVVAGRRAGGRVVLEEVHRFANRPVRLPDGLHWSLPELFGHALDGIGAAAARGPLAGVGVDAWGVDYALLDGAGAMLGLPFHYRDARTEGMEARAFDRVPADELYAATGIQTLPINTVFQLLAEEGTPRLAAAERLAFVPDLVAYWLSGVLANESTCASTSGLLDARTGRWALGLVGRLGLPERLFAEVVEPGERLGPLLAGHAAGLGLPGRPPWWPSRHTTPPRPTRALRSSTARRRSCRAAPGRCSGWSCPGRCWRMRPARPTSPTNVAWTGRRGC